MRHTSVLHYRIQSLRQINDSRIALARGSDLRNQLRPHGSAVLVDSALFQLRLTPHPQSNASTSKRLLVELGTNVPHVLNALLLQRGAARHLTLPEGRLRTLQLHSAAILRLRARSDAR